MVLCFIGTACATGHVIDIPIIICSLADSLGHVNYEELPLPIHPSMLAILDAGVTTYDPARLVDVYHLNWWAGTDEPDEDDVLHMFNVDKCLEFHQQQLTPGTSLPEPSAPAPARTPVPADLCPRCPALRHVAEGLLTELVEINASVAAMGEVHFAQSDIAMRSAAGLHLMHEKVTLKELQTKTPTPALPTLLAASSSRLSRTQTRSEQIRLRAEHELELLRSQSQPALKWTWGPDLTENDILANKGKQKAHSGYRQSLPAGHARGEWSVTASLPAGTEVYSQVGCSENLPPHPSVARLHSALESMSLADEAPATTPLTVIWQNMVDLAAEAYTDDSAESTAGSHVADPAALAAAAWSGGESDTEEEPMQAGGMDAGGMAPAASTAGHLAVDPADAAADAWSGGETESEDETMEDEHRHPQAGTSDCIDTPGSSDSSSSPRPGRSCC